VRLGEAVLLPKLGPQANEGDVVYILIAAAHEHLGQLIAYARQNGIVPPWTVQMQKKKAGCRCRQINASGPGPTICDTQSS
jgi:hypothetical protein